ncbi:hypothetical protein ACIRSS_05895 [Amycolatopsis sp. NPDC101161]|uniref:hypothetical protein n=1 Tax=Amycolatopsis sp. NPDC101161 TaxID=3363940 RepID=UPI0037FB94CE
MTTTHATRITTADLHEWPGPDAELLGAVDAVVRDHSLSEAQWANLSGRYRTAGAIVRTYSLLRPLHVRPQERTGGA